MSRQAWSCRCAHAVCGMSVIAGGGARWAALLDPPIQWTVVLVVDIAEVPVGTGPSGPCVDDPFYFGEPGGHRHGDHEKPSSRRHLHETAHFVEFAAERSDVTLPG